MEYASSSMRTTRRTKWHDHKNVVTDSANLNKIYLGITKDARDPQKMGRILVYIPELGAGDPNRPESWVIASYCSPFAGSTLFDRETHAPQEGDTVSRDDNYEYNTKRAENRTPPRNTTLSGRQSYGMWFVPPDIGNEVIVSFLNGDPNNCIWMGCLYGQHANHMVPGIGSAMTSNEDGTPTGKFSPALEHDPRQGFDKGHDDVSRLEYKPLADGLRKQGLSKDFDPEALNGGQRGQSLSSAQRESPSEVFGILTPDGNQFVMDDGVFNEDGTKTRSHEFIRLRTKSGAQLLIHETDGFVYMISRDGKTWLELGNDGDVHVYGANNINMHALSGDINLKAGRHVNIQAGVDITLAAGRDITSQAGSNINTTSGTETNFKVGSTHSVSVGSTYAIKTGGAIGITGGGDIRAQAPNIHLNSGAGVQPTATVRVGNQTMTADLGSAATGPTTNTNNKQPPKDDGTGDMIPGDDDPEGATTVSKVPQAEPSCVRPMSQSEQAMEKCMANPGAPTTTTETTPVSGPAGNLTRGQKQESIEGSRLLDNDKVFQAKFKEMQRKYNGKPSRKELYGIIEGESTFDPAAKADNSSASGLFQFTDGALETINKRNGTNYTTGQVRNMSPAQQLDLYDKYLEVSNYKGDRHLGLIQAAPYSKARKPGEVVYERNSPGWRGNPSWQDGGTGPVTVRAITKYYRDKEKNIPDPEVGSA